MPVHNKTLRSLRASENRLTHSKCACLYLYNLHGAGFVILTALEIYPFHSLLLSVSVSAIFIYNLNFGI